MVYPPIRKLRKQKNLSQRAGEAIGSSQRVYAYDDPAPYQKKS